MSSSSPGSCVRLRHVGHLDLMRQPRLGDVERDRHGEDGAAVLDRLDVARGEALAVADAVDLVDDRHFGIAAEQEIGVQRMRRPRRHVLDGAAGGDQRLADHLAAEHPLPARLRRAAAEQVHLQRLEIENVEDFLNGGGHALSCADTRARLLAYGFRGRVKPGAGRDRMGAMTRENVDVLIAGGGFAGLTLAIALRQALGPSFAVTVADPALGVSHADDERASAIVAAARRLFETLGVWDSVSRRRRSRSSTWWSPTAGSTTPCGRCFSPSPARSSRASRSPI